MKRVQITLTEVNDTDTSRIESNVSQLSGVHNASMNVSSKTLTAECEDYIAEDQLISTLRQAGYAVSDIFFEKMQEDFVKGKEAPAVQHKAYSEGQANMIWSWVFALPLLFLLVLELFVPNAWVRSPTMKVLLLLVSFPIIFVRGWSVLRAGWQGIVTRAFDTSTLILISVGGGYLTGVLSMFTSVTSYAGVVGIIMALFITGKYLEDKVQGASQKDLRLLTHLLPSSAVILIQGKEVSAPLSEVQAGDLLVLRAGDHVAADGIVVKGTGSFDESRLTGEVSLKRKGPGEAVVAGSVVYEGKVVIEVLKTGKETFLSNVFKIVEETQGTRTSLQRSMNRLTKFIVPATFILAVLTFGAWLLFTQDLAKAFNAAFAVLVIACPASLGLAIPSVLFIGAGIAARRGILVRNGESFQALKEVRTILIDKAGTVTQGMPEVSYVTSLIKEKELLDLAASLEHQHDALLAKALAERAGIRRYKRIEKYAFFAGKGAEGESAGKVILVGNKKFMAERSIALHGLGARVQEYEESGKKALLVAINGKIAGAIAISDFLKEDAIKSIARLKKMNYYLILMDSDNERTVKALAKKLSIPEVYLEQSPAETLAKIQELQHRGGVAFVTSPGRNVKAVNQSNVGIVMGTESDFGHGTEDILITKSAATGIVEVVQLAKEAQRKIQQNLMLGFGYNILAIPLAVLGFLHPIVAEAAMIATTLSVLVNANLLRSKSIF